MAKNSNAFDLLADYENDDLSLLITDHLKATTKKPPSKSPKPTKKTLAPSQSIVNAQAPQSKPVKQTNLGRGSDDLQNDCVLERGFFRKFGVSEDGEFEKPQIGVALRSKSRGGPRRSYRYSSRLFCHPGREYVDQETEDYAVMMSSKYRLFDRHSSSGRSNGGKSEGFGWWNWGTMMGDQELEQWSAELANSIEDDMNVDQSDEDEFENKSMANHKHNEPSKSTSWLIEMTLDEYEKVRKEKKRALQAILLELAAKRKDDEDFINEFVIIEAAEAEGFQL